MQNNNVREYYEDVNLRKMWRQCSFLFNEPRCVPQRRFKAGSKFDICGSHLMRGKLSQFITQLLSRFHFSYSSVIFLRAVICTRYTFILIIQILNYFHFS